jgi:hypothetical protein
MAKLPMSRCGDTTADLGEPSGARGFGRGRGMTPVAPLLGPCCRARGERAWNRRGTGAEPWCTYIYTTL